MTSPVLWSLIVVQLALGLFDIVYHHELTERLPWRRSQRLNNCTASATSHMRRCSSRSASPSRTASGRCW